MSIAVIWSSPNMDGLTAHCKNTVMEAITAAGKECFDIQLNRYNLQRCNVCDSGKGICAEGKCHYTLQRGLPSPRGRFTAPSPHRPHGK